MEVVFSVSLTPQFVRIGMSPSWKTIDFGALGGAFEIVWHGAQFHAPAPIPPLRNQVAAMGAAGLRRIRAQFVVVISWQADASGIGDRPAIGKGNDTRHMGMAAQSQTAGRQTKSGQVGGDLIQSSFPHCPWSAAMQPVSIVVGARLGIQVNGQLIWSSLR